MIETKVTFNVRPFFVPTYAEETPTPAPQLAQPVLPPGATPMQIPLARLEPSSLSELCDRFRADVFEKAGKSDPKEQPVEQPRRSSPMMDIYVDEEAVDLLREKEPSPGELITHWYDVRLNLLVPKEDPETLSARVSFERYLNLVRARSPADLLRILDSITWTLANAE